MGLIANWKAARERRRLADAFLQRLLVPIEPRVVEWLASACGDVSVAQRELTFARRAIGLTAAGRDALDDRTASDVARAMAPLLETEARQSARDASEWADRWQAYRSALAARGVPDSPTVRFARIMLSGVGIGQPAPSTLTQAADVLQSMRGLANEALRASFGAASLPEDIRPSALRS